MEWSNGKICILIAVAVLVASFAGCLGNSELINKPASDMVIKVEDLGDNWSTYPGDSNVKGDSFANVYLYYPSSAILDRERIVHSVLRVFNSTDDARSHFQQQEEIASNFNAQEVDFGDEGFKYVFQNNHSALYSIRIDNVYLEMVFSTTKNEISIDSEWVNSVLEIQLSKIT